MRNPSPEAVLDLLALALVTRNQGAEDLSADWRSEDGAWMRVRFTKSGTVADAVAGATVGAGDPMQETPDLDPARVRRIRERLSPEVALSSLHTLDDAEWDAVVVGPNRNGGAPLPTETLGKLFHAAALQHPDSIATSEDGRTVDYRTLYDHAARVAACLAEAGVLPGQAVGILAPRSTEAVAAIAGCALAGVAYVPLSPDWPNARIEQMARDTAMAFVLTASPAMTVADVPGRLIAAATSHPTGVELPAPGSSDDVAYIMFTSGSTGTPKGVLTPHRGVIRLARDRWLHPVAAGQSVMHAAPLGFDASTKEIWVPLLNGGCVTILPRETLLSAPALAATRGQIDFAFFTTALFRSLVEQDATCLVGIGHIYVGGEAVPEALFGAARSVAGIGRIMHCYGPTETTVYALAEEVLPGRESLLGKPIAATTAYVLDPDLRPVPPGVEGEICIGGAGVALGYLHDLGRTAEQFVRCPPELGHGLLYRTGDRGSWRQDGRIAFHGRRDHQIKLRGHRIELGEIEAAITAQPGVSAAAVRSHQPDDGETRLIAWVRFSDPASIEASAEALREVLPKVLPDYMRPAWILPVEAFPLTAHGKIDHARLPRPRIEVQATADDDPHEGIAQLLRAALVQPGFTRDDSFLDQGGTSLMAVRLVHQIANRWQVTPPVRLFFQDRTADRLGRFVTFAQRHNQPASSSAEVRPNAAVTRI